MEYDNILIGLVISKLEVEENEIIHDYMVRFPDRNVVSFRVKTGQINVGNKVEVGKSIEDDGSVKYKILKIV